MRIFEIEDDKLNLPEDVVNAFVEIGHLQRGGPEHAMLKVQQIMGGGVLNPVVEHVGDLTHRMTHMINNGNTGHEFVSDKVDKTIRWLTHPYGFEKEYRENVRNNAKHMGLTPEELQKKLDIALRKYAQEHEKLPVYNRAQWLARQAAVAIGYQNFDQAVLYLYRLKDLVDSGNWTQEATKFERDNQGNLKEYSPH